MSPCTWPISRECLPPLPVLGDTPTTEEQAAYDLALLQRNQAEDLAVFVLWSLSGRQFGACPVTVRPCVNPSWTVGGCGLSPYILTLTDGHWSTWPCGCFSACEVSGPRAVHLPGPAQPDTDDTPIVVTVAGVALDHDQYALEGNVLYRVGGAWPRQDLGRPLGEAGTWSVSYSQGILPPPETAPLVGLLAKEFISACNDDEECRLPRFVTSTARKGATTVFDPAKILANGKTGLPEVDLWLAAANPNHLASAPAVL